MDDIATAGTAAPERSRRKPAPVTSAAAMLAISGALLVVEVVLSLERYRAGERVHEQATADGLIEPVGSFFAEGAFVAAAAALHVIPALVGAVIGGLLVVLAFFTAFGHDWARAVAWILSFPVLIGYGALAILDFALPSSHGPGPVDPASRELMRRYQQAWPGWLDMLDTVLMVAVTSGLLAALVCQTVPAADAYFRLRRRRIPDGHPV